MKFCPTCRKTYTDEGLNFCLEDGSVLTRSGSDAPATMVMPAPPATTPSIGVGAPSTQPTWERPSYSVQPKKKSKAWIWVLGLVTLGLLLCGGGIGGIALLSMMGGGTDQANSNSNSQPNNRNSSDSSSTTPGRTKLRSVDLSGWAKSLSADIVSEYTNNELILGTKQRRYYYVLVSQEDDQTENANTRLTVRNSDNADSDFGYGLVFHSNPSPLKQDYAFLIDTKKKRYRVVRHVPQDEPVVVRWTNSSAIKDGTQENVLEARDNNGNIDLYINDQKVTSIRNTHGFKGGVAGVYTGDAARAAFSKLEIRK